MWTIQILNPVTHEVEEEYKSKETPRFWKESLLVSFTDFETGREHIVGGVPYKLVAPEKV
jgi:hypothetical protein